MDDHLIELYVMGIALDSRTGTPIVVLNYKENRAALPIWIGTAEASAIIRQLENIKTARPMTHDLIFNILDTTGYRLSRIEINDLSSDTYYASVYINQPNGQEQIVDARPSDAIALAMRSKAPIFATANVVAEGTISTDQVRDEEEAQAFREFLKDIKPGDFKKFKPEEESEH